MQEKKTRSIAIDYELFTEINEYCKMNNLKVQKKINEMLQKQFLIEKWGEMPSIFMEETPPTENNTTKIKTGSNNKAVEINNIVETNYNNKIETKKRRLT